jgi:pimeloyl-ACP methyl ester carboxylesterase
MGELADERRAASEAIRGLRMSPILFEIGARPHPPRELYKAYLLQSDVFVGIYGEKYGWIDPSMTVSGIEDEYELSAEKPRLIYLKASLKRDKRLAELLDRITTEGSACYKKFSSAEELRELIVDDLAVLLSERFPRVPEGQEELLAAVASREPDSRAAPQTPEMKYVTTADGLSIAYYTIGQGPAVLDLMLPFSHLEAEWHIRSFRRLYSTVAEHNTFIRLDHRGFGLSDRNPPDYSIESLILDIEAVVDRLAIDQLSIYSVAQAVIPALAYTARHQDIVTHLAQATPLASWADATNERLTKLFELAEIDWDLATETITRSFNPGADEPTLREIVGLIRSSIDGDSFLRFLADMQKWDADADARTISTPTLLIHRKNQNVNIAATRRVAGLVKNSRVVFVDSDDFQGLLLAQKFFSDSDVDPGR